MAGSVGQVRESSQRLLQAGKKHGIPVFLVGHVTKSGTLAGPKVLEHLVDAVLDLTGERTGAYRILRASKNRFGATDEVGVFSMSDKGMEEVANPSAAFLEESQTGTPGSAVVAIMEGTRPVLVEIQALVINSQLAIPRRVSNGISINKVQLLTAVLQKRCGLVGLGTSDIFVNVAGGIHIKEPAADIGIALAIASSLKNQSLPVKLAVIGEIGLLGEIRQVSFLNKRVAEAKKLGFSQVVAPNKYKNLNQVVKRLFS
jgi:DNA repair protein RadA/Sms